MSLFSLTQKAHSLRASLDRDDLSLVAPIGEKFHLLLIRNSGQR